MCADWNCSCLSHLSGCGDSSLYSVQFKIPSRESHYCGSPDGCSDALLEHHHYEQGTHLLLILQLSVLQALCTCIIYISIAGEQVYCTHSL